MRDPSQVMIRDSVPLVRAARTHYLRDEQRWRRLVRIAPELKVNLERQQVSAARRKSLWETRGRATTRLSRTAGGKSRWRINVACGRPVRCMMTRTQRKVARSLSLKKHLVYFPWVRESMRGQREVAADEGCEVAADESFVDVIEEVREDEVQLEGDDGSQSLFSVLEQPIGKYNCHMI